MIRRDKNALTFFDPRNGSKVRFTIGKYTKARVPELVDIKINDYCPFACDFCYQGSTPSGGHSTLEQMLFVADELAKHKVFEVALGGGEPTMHPQFKEILHAFHSRGVVPNFTTKNPGYIKREWENIEHLVGAFAYSAEDAKHIALAAEMFVNVDPAKVNLHYVMGLGDRQHFFQYLLAARYHGFRVTLLGYKTSGRGGDVKPHNYDWWIDVVKMLVDRELCPTLSIDTPLAAEYDGVMPVDKRLYHTREGWVSMYIDAPAMKMGASSFEHLDSLVPFDKDWIKRYETI
jgi:hypothetical protein